MVSLLISCHSTQYDYAQISGKSEANSEVWVGEEEVEHEFMCRDVSWEQRFKEEGLERGFKEEIPDLKDICPFCNPRVGSRRRRLQ